MRNPIMVALDVATAEQALGLVDRLAGVVGGFKIGKELFVAAGPDVVRAVRARGGEVFLDLKFHDIPNTVARAVEAAVRLDVQMLTIHTSGGREMMEAAERAAQEAARRLGKPAPWVLGVTVLTSLDSAAMAEMGLDWSVARQVERLALLAARAGLRGLVCSPLEIESLRRVLPRELKLVTPGIRPAGSAGDDQKRTMGPREAIAAGADVLVVGRPIVAAADPELAARSIVAEAERGRAVT